MMTPSPKELVEMIAAKTGNVPSTICAKVLNNPRWYRRHLDRQKQDAEAASKLKAYFDTLPASDGCAE